MNGKVESYKLNDPMSWKEFKAMPDDIKITYIKLLRTKFNVDGKNIAEMLGINVATYSKEINRLGISTGKNSRGRCTKWDKEGWFSWCNGAPIPDTDQVEETPEAAEQPELERQLASLERICDPVPALEIKTLPVKDENHKAIPCNGSMIFEGRIEDVLNSVSVLLGGAFVHINIQWDVISKGE